MTSLGFQPRNIHIGTLEKGGKSSLDVTLEEFMFPWDPLSDIYDVCNWLERKAWKTNPLQTKAKHSKRQQTFFFSRSHTTFSSFQCRQQQSLQQQQQGFLLSGHNSSPPLWLLPHTSTTKCWPFRLDWKVVLSIADIPTVVAKKINLLTKLCLFCYCFDAKFRLSCKVRRQVASWPPKLTQI